HHLKMSEMTEAEKVKVLLAQALFGNPDLLLLDEPTNGLDIQASQWLEEFLINFENTVIVVFHDRHFLNKVCTHIADVDYGKIEIFSGDYDFWYDASQPASPMAHDQNKRMEVNYKKIQEDCARFIMRVPEVKRARSRRRLLDRSIREDIKPS